MLRHSWIALLSISFGSLPLAYGQGDPAADPSAGVTIRFRVEGLTEEGAARLTEDLRRLESVADTTTAPLGTDGGFDGYLAVKIAPGSELHLSKLDERVAAVGEGAWRIDRGSILLVGECQLQFEGVSDEEGQERLVEALNQVAGVRASRLAETDLGRVELVAEYVPAAPHRPIAIRPDTPEPSPQYSDEERRILEELRRRAQENMRGGIGPAPMKPGVEVRHLLVSISRQDARSGREPGEARLREIVWRAPAID